LGQPALASFLDQNWLEGWDRGAAARHFAEIFERLGAGGFVDREGRPTRRLAQPRARPGIEHVDREAALVGARLAAPAPGFEPA
jgi:hypothetical protein